MQRTVRPFVTLCFGLVWIVATLAASGIRAADHAPHDLWTISSREAGSHCGGVPRLSYWRHDAAANRWIRSHHEAFVAAADPQVPTCFFVHGNRISRNNAFYVGWQAYRGLANQWPTDRPLRFVIWSWPSTEIRGQLADVRYKAYVSDAHAYHLAWLLDQMNPQTAISLFGYSYGSRLITGSLHLLGGGQLSGNVLAHQVHPEPSHLRAILMAGALDRHSLAPNGRNGQALSQADEVLVLVNPCDDVLRHYPKLRGLLPMRQGPEAIGYVGAAGMRYAGTNGQKVQHWNITRVVGSEHDYNRYLNSSAIMARVRDSTLIAAGG